MGFRWNRLWLVLSIQKHFNKTRNEKILLPLLFLTLGFQVLFAQSMIVNSGKGLNLREGPGTKCLELFDNPFSFFGQGGLGIRYNFK